PGRRGRADPAAGVRRAAAGRCRVPPRRRTRLPRPAARPRAGGHGMEASRPAGAGAIANAAVLAAGALRRGGLAGRVRPVAAAGRAAPAAGVDRAALAALVAWRRGPSADRKSVV